MLSLDLTPTSFAYVDSDLADGQTLVEWRRERDAARRAERRARRAFRLPSLPRPRSLPRLRPAT